ncbi:MAG: hypothetical protein AAFN77_01575 [Planctomycetota bacterium]
MPQDQIDPQRSATITGTALFFAAAFIVLASGCKPSADSAASNMSSTENKTTQSTDSTGTNRFGDNWTAEQVLSKTLERYATAKTYRDQGVLDLSYRLNGQTLKEPKQFQTTFDRGSQLSPTQKFALQSCNTDVRGNGKVLACQVFDLETGNFENQRLLIPYPSEPTGTSPAKVPLDSLFRDPIAKHFVAGFDELPLNEAFEDRGPLLVPAPLSLLTGQVSNGWLQRTEQSERMSDQVLGRQDCFVVRALFENMTCDVWILKDDFRIVKMSLPIKLLAREVAASPEVTDVSLVARFEKSEFDVALDESAFRTELDDQSVLVRKFVSLPEPLPSELIGRSAPKFHLLATDGRKVDRLVFDQKTTALIWVEGADAIEAIKGASEILTSLPSQSDLAIVFSNAELKRESPDQIEPLSRIVELGKQLNCNVYFDPRHSVSSQLKLKRVPAALLMDGDSKIHFANFLDEATWADDLVMAIRRVARGEDLAQEMKHEYANYLDSYYEKLSTVEANHLAKWIGDGSKITQVSQSNASSRLKLNPTQLWRCDEFKQPGNIVPLSSAQSTLAASDHYAVFDGWQSMGMIDVDGKLKRRVTLQLATNEAATQVRRSMDQPLPRFAVFSPFGESVYLYSSSFSEPFKFSAGERAQIRDVRFCDLDQNGSSELIVAMKQGGIWLVDPSTGDRQQLNDANCESLVGFSSDIVVLANGKLTTIKSQREFTGELAKSSGWSVSHLAAAGNQQIVATGKTRAGRWSAIAFDDEFKRLWTLEVGPQLFETTVQPISSTRWRDDLVWAIADSNHLIQLVTGSGKWIGEFQSPAPLHGLTLSKVNVVRNGKPTVDVALTIANDDGVESWSLGITSE